MTSKTAKADSSKQEKKQTIGKKRKLPTTEQDDLDLFSYDNKIELTFGYSTKNTKTMITIDSSDEDDDESDADASEFARISEDEEEVADDSQELLQIDDSEDLDNSIIESSPKRTLQTRSPSPPPLPSQADFLRVQRQLRAKNKKTRDFDTAYIRLQQVVADTVSPLPPTNRQTSEVINLDDSVSPLIVRNRNDRKITVKVRTRSGIKRFEMRLGDKFETIIKDLADGEKVPPENILLSLKNSNILPDDTPLSKGVSVADIIECIIMESSIEEEEENLIEIKVQGNDAESRKTFHVSKTKPLERLFAEYAEFRKINRSKLKFLFDDEVVQGCETPEDLDMEDENMIDVRVIK